MSLSATVNGFINNGQITIAANDSALAAGVNTVLNNYFNAKLCAKVNTPTASGKNSLVCSGTLSSACSLYTGKSSAAVQLEFTQSANGVQLVIRLSIASAYRFADSFTVLTSRPQDVLNTLETHSISFVVDSTATDSIQLATTINNKGPLARLSWFEASTNFSGSLCFKPLDSNTQAPVFDLSAELADSHSLGFASDITAKFTARLKSTVVSVTGAEKYAISTLQLETELGDANFSIPIVMPLYAGNSQHIISARFQSNEGLSLAQGFTSLGKFIDCSFIENTLPDDFPVANKLKLKRASLALNPQTMRFFNFHVGVEFDCLWSLFNGKFTLNNISADVSMAELAKPKQLGLSLKATCTIGGANFETYVALPEKSFSAQLMPGSSLAIDELLSHCSPGLQLPGSGDISINSLQLTADTPNKQYGFEAAGSGSWTIVNGLTIKSVSVYLQEASSVLQSAGFSGQLSIATSTPLQLSLIANRYGDGHAASHWSMSADGHWPTPLPLADIANDIFGQFGLTGITLPDSLNQLNLSISELGVAYDTGTETFEFSFTLDKAASFSSITGNDISTGANKNKTFSSFKLTTSKQANGERKTQLSLSIDPGIQLSELLDLQGDLPIASDTSLEAIHFTLDINQANNDSAHCYQFSTCFQQGSNTNSQHTFYFTGNYSKRIDGNTTTACFGGNIYSKQGQSLSLTGDFPIDVSIKDLFIAKVSISQLSSGKTSATHSYTLFGSDISAHGDIDLSRLPVVGQFLSAAKFSFQSLRFVYAKASTTAASKGAKPKPSQQPISSANLTLINAFLGQLHVAPLTTARSSTANQNQSQDNFDLGFTLQGSLVLGNNNEVIPLHSTLASGSDANGQGNNHGQASAQHSTSLNPTTTNQAASPTAVGKTFGPVTIKKVGLGLASGKVQIQFSGGISMGPLTLDFIGFDIDSPVDTFDPSISLQGLGLTINKPPLALEGMFMHGTVNVPVSTQQTTKAPPASLCVQAAGHPLHNDDSINLTAGTTIAKGQSSAPIAVSISNSNAGKALTIKSITHSGQDFAISALNTPLSLAHSTAPHTFNIVFSPHSAGFKQGSITIVSDDANVPEFVINLRANETASIPAHVKTIPIDAYNGSLSISYNDYSLTALGSYAQLPGGDISTFLYGFLGAPLGGPPFLFVTGVAAGFGYNRALTLPTAETVNTWPLIAPVMPNADSSLDFDAMNLMFMPTKGDFWGAIGIRAESFKMVESFVLLDVQFKDMLEIDIIGLSQMSFPAPPDEDTNEPALAKIKLGLVARIIPEQGVVAINGAFLPGSYVMNPAAHVSGGFAVLSLFKDQDSGQWQGGRSGDFVVTLGGYASSYQPKSYYPQVPRLEMNWQVSSALSLKASAYFAITPQAMMAGGHLEANFQEGGSFSIHVNFQVGADFIVYWQPYHYSASFYAELNVTASVSVDLWLFTLHASVNMDLGADLTIWGPDFSGSGSVHIHVLITFAVHVSFGNAPNQPPPIAWSAFEQSLLPKPEKILTASVSQGLVAGQSSDSYQVVNPKELSIQCGSAMPLKSSVINGAGDTGSANTRTVQITLGSGAETTLAASAAGHWHNETPDVLDFDSNTRVLKRTKSGIGRLTFNNSTQSGQSYTLFVSEVFGIKPMAKTVDDITECELAISISKNGYAMPLHDISQSFDIATVDKNMPGALWEPAADSGIIPSSRGADLMQHLASGLSITAKPAIAQGKGFDFNTADANDNLHMPAGEALGAFSYEASTFNDNH